MTNRKSSIRDTLRESLRDLGYAVDSLDRSDTESARRYVRVALDDLSLEYVRLCNEDEAASG